MNDKIYTLPEVAVYLKLSKTKIYGMVRKGKMPHLKIGRSLRIRESDLNRWIEANCITIKTPDGYPSRFHPFGK